MYISKLITWYEIAPSISASQLMPTEIAGEILVVVAWEENATGASYIVVAV